MKNNFIPALKYHFLTPFYDLIIRVLMPEYEVKKRVIDLLELNAPDKMLDFGCGTGTLLEILSVTHPEVKAYGYDVDPAILEIARKKDLGNAGLVLGEGNALPFAGQTFDKIASTWVFHHLDLQQKRQGFSELYRIMKPGGVLIVADWGRPANFLMRFLFFLVQVVDNFHTTADNVAGKMPDYMVDAGFIGVKAVGYRNTLFGTLSYHKAFKAAEG